MTLKSARADQLWERIVKVGLPHAVHGLLGKESPLVVAGDLNVSVLNGPVGQEARARTSGAGGWGNGSDSVDAPDLSTRAVLVHPIGDASTLLGGPDVQILFVGAELSNGPVEAGSVGDTRPGGVDGTEAGERVVAGGGKLNERAILLAVSLAVQSVILGELTRGGKGESELTEFTLATMVIVAIFATLPSAANVVHGQGNGSA